MLNNYLLKLNTPILPNLDAVPPATLAVLNYDNSSLSLSNPLFNSSSVWFLNLNTLNFYDIRFLSL